MILVTGGTGLVGSHLLFDLCKAEKKVRATKRSTTNLGAVKKVFAYYSNSPETLFKKIEWIDADLLDVYSLIDIMKDVDEVYHCAAMVSFQAKHQEEMMRINVDGTANMVNAALEVGVKKFCYVSSIATIGKNEYVDIADETLLWKSSPEHSNYAISKYGAEREVWRAAEEGLNVVIVNPSLIIGPGNWLQSSSTIFANGYKAMPFYTSGVNGFVDVRDVSKAMIELMALEKFNQRFILNSENIPYKHLLSIMHKAFCKPEPKIKIGNIVIELAWRIEKIRCMLTGATPFLTKETARSAMKKSFYSNKKILNALNQFQFIPLEQAITDTCKLYIKDLAM